jgi:elongation factor Ts
MAEPVRIAAETEKRLRELTGAGMMECKTALQEADGDMEKAQEILRKKGLAGIDKRRGRRASEGVIESYIHPGSRVGALVEVSTETDFVARTDEFKRLAREIAMQVAATSPRWVSREEVPDDVVGGERKIYEEQARAGGKPDSVLPRIVDGMLEKFYKQTVLLDQPYIRDDSKTVADLVSEVAAKVGENVVVRRFARFGLGEEL